MTDAERTSTLDLDGSPLSRRPLPGLVRVFREGSGRVLVWPVPQRLVVGRDSAEGLDDGSLSRRHFQIDTIPGGFEVTDLGSRNGTRVNLQRSSGEPVRTSYGAVIRAGASVFLVLEDVRPHLDAAARELPELGGPGMDAVRRSIFDAASNALPVTILGESGAGKERVARTIHGLSQRRGQFVAVNCGALPMQLVESELFGHQRGSFSGSEAQRAGLFRAADSGTLFLDEIGELPLAAQAALLRVLDSGEVRPVGADRSQHVDVRVISATNRDLRGLVAAGLFRADLYHRLSGVVAQVPPLRGHREDVIPLCQQFASESGVALSASAAEELLVYDWPGNVRELRLAVLTACARVTRERRTEIAPRDLALPRGSSALAPEARGVPDDVVLKVRIETALRIHRGNVTHAARDLDMGRSTIYELITRLGIDPSTFRER